MKNQLGLVAIFAVSMMLSACGKNQNEETTETAGSEAQVSTKITAEQQAAIDAIDQPVLDEKNTDVPAEISNTAADVATAEVSSSEAASH